GVFGENVAEVRGGRVPIVEILKVLLHQHRVAKELFTDLEVVQVRVRPAHRRLNVLVQLVERAVLNLNSPPDRRMAVEQRDLELVNERRWIAAVDGLCGCFEDVPEGVP